jgi:hypothetical protein
MSSDRGDARLDRHSQAANGRWLIVEPRMAKSLWEGGWFWGIVERQEPRVALRKEANIIVEPRWELLLWDLSIEA